MTILLAITGFFVFTSYDFTAAEMKSGEVSVGVTVPGPGPANGATITKPTSGAVFKNPIIDVEGTCNRNTAVIVYSNSTLVGSTLCDDPTLTFALQIQLLAGANNLTALNYDTLNQAGPITPMVNVTYDIPVPPSSPEPELPIHPVIVPTVTPKPPASCAVDATPLACNLWNMDVKTCNGYVFDKDLPKSKEVRVAIVCLPRHVAALDVITMGILVWGGQPPYELKIDWGGNATTVADVSRTITKPGYYVVTASYEDAGNYDIEVHVTDRMGKKTYAQSAIQVPGSELAAQSGENFGQYIAKSFSISWFDTPVPTYLLAVAIVLGFWAGDYFERVVKKVSGSSGKKRRKRHA